MRILKDLDASMGHPVQDCSSALKRCVPREQDSM